MNFNDENKEPGGEKINPENLLEETEIETDALTTESEDKLKKNTNPFSDKIRYFREALTVDFDKPLSFSDQLIIMFVILFISIILFGFIFLVSNINSLMLNGELAEANTESNVIVSRSDAEASGGEAFQRSDLTDSSASVEASDSKKSQESSEKENSSQLFNECEIEIENSKKTSGTLILVNKDCRCESDGENVIALTQTDNVHYDVTDNNVSFDKDKVVYLNKMLEDFYNIFGDTDIMIACGYRGYDMQARLYNQEIENKGTTSAEMWVAPPGHSEHQTGLAFDFNLNLQNGSGGIQYSGENIYSWLNDNCYKYGFIVRYMLGKEQITGYEYEPWHFRYVGEAAATYIFNNELTLEEYLDIVHTHSVKNPLIIEGKDNKKWCTYYIEASSEDETVLTVPYDRDYEISGDNYSGFIITVQL